MSTRLIGALPFLVLMALTVPATAQTNLRAHYGRGQVWVVWEANTAPAETTLAVYGSDAPITSLAEAEMIGRLFAYEYFPGARRDQFGPADAGWVIPDSAGAARDTLAANEALFVETVHASGSRYYAVVAWGDTLVTPGVNATISPAMAIYDPADPVQCHLQLEAEIDPGYESRLYCMWADGRVDPEDSRPDFPVCANPAKNGMPSLFLVSGSTGLGAGPHPVTYWLHGGPGSASQSTPAKRPYVNIDPLDGILVAHNDDLVRYIAGALVEQESNSWWFGWATGLDPFEVSSVAASPGDRVINYTQRRLVWIHDWLTGIGLVDPDRTSIQGHSVGSAGATAFTKAFPEKIATCCLFNNGFAGPVGGGGYQIFGVPGDSLRCNLIDATGDSIPVYAAFDLNSRLSVARDLPLIRSWHGKNDINEIMMWSPLVVAEYERADSLGWGMQLYWDERQHGLPSPYAYWAEDTFVAAQTQRDNAAYQQRYRVGESFPAFHNHRIQAGASWPGDGTGGTSQTGGGVGDDWGTWGGYHDWDPDSIVDTPGTWSADIFLIDSSAWIKDNAPADSLVSDFALRRPQAFLPDPGEVVEWIQVETSSGDTLASGAVTVEADGLVRIPNIVTYRDPRRTRIELRHPTLVGVDPGPRGTALPGVRMTIAPNPFRSDTVVRMELDQESAVRVRVFDVSGRLVSVLVDRTLPAGAHAVKWSDRGSRGRRLAPGAYIVRLEAGGLVLSSKVLRLD